MCKPGRSKDLASLVRGVLEGSVEVFEVWEGAGATIPSSSSFSLCNSLKKPTLAKGDRAQETHLPRPAVGVRVEGAS